MRSSISILAMAAALVATAAHSARADEMGRDSYARGGEASDTAPQSVQPAATPPLVIAPVEAVAPLGTAVPFVSAGAPATDRVAVTAPPPAIGATSPVASAPAVVRKGGRAVSPAARGNEIAQQPAAASDSSTAPEAAPLPNPRTDTRGRAVDNLEFFPGAKWPELDDVLTAQVRRRPGQEYNWPRNEPSRSPTLPPDPNAVPLPPQSTAPPDFIPVPDRWRLVESLNVKNENLLDPYNQNTLKGDRPIFGDDYFIVLSAISDTVFEPRSFPLPVALNSAPAAGRNDNFGQARGQTLFNQNLILSASLIKGDTAFTPQDFELRLTPVFNINYLDVPEQGVVNLDPRKGTDRQDGHIGLQEGFFEYHLRNVSERYDFDSVRMGIQPFSTDFRGFLFQDSQLGLRFFGNRDNNKWQYNLAWFRRFEKDTNSGLNDLAGPLRDDDIFIANVYRQDLPVLGMTSQLTVVHNRNREDNFFYDKNGFLARPQGLGDERPRTAYDVTYLGANMDGHFGRVNFTGSFYYAIGSEEHNQFTTQPADIRAYFAAVEPSIDFDWIRLRLSGAYASGDHDPHDNKETGFDAIFENPQFAGADTSYWIRQQIPFIGGGVVGLKGRNALFPALRSSKELGQSSFNNPGLILAGLGTDFDITPELRFSTNFNHLWFESTTGLEFLRNQGHIRKDIGTDLSGAFIYRPGFIQNVVFRLSGAVLIAGDGFKDVYASTDKDDVYYSVLANVILTY